jgi:hypothetical protein
LNGDQTQNTLNVAPTIPLAQANNFVVFSGVHSAGGTLSVDVSGATNTLAGHVDGYASVNGFQLQLVSLDPPTNKVTLVSTPGAGNSSLTLNWTQGILQTATNLNGPWSAVYAPAPYTATVVTTNRAQFYRVKVTVP